MKKIYDFHCTTCAVTKEYWAETEVTALRCDQCGDLQTRRPSLGHFSLDPLSGHYPSATQQWAKNREIKIKQERKVEANHGPQDW